MTESVENRIQGTEDAARKDWEKPSVSRFAADGAEGATGAAGVDNGIYS